MDKMRDNFLKAFKKTMEIEGWHVLTNRSDDPGGETYSGISRVFWPDWEGWELVDKGDLDKKDLEKLGVMTEEFYRVNFWNRIQGDKVCKISQSIAEKVFDTAVNTGVHTAVKLLQKGYNVAVQNDYRLVEDGILGTKTISGLLLYLSLGNHDINEEILLNCLNGEQYIFYKKLPHYRQNRGWFRRI